MALGQEDLTRSIFRANRYFVGTESDDPAIANGGLGTEITDELLALIGFTGENVIFQGDSEMRVTDAGTGDITAKVDTVDVFSLLAASQRMGVLGDTYTVWQQDGAPDGKISSYIDGSLRLSQSAAETIIGDEFGVGLFVSQSGNINLQSTGAVNVGQFGSTLQRVGINGDTFASFTQSTDIVSVQSGGDEMINLAPTTQRFGSTSLGDYYEILQPIGENPAQINTYVGGRLRQAIFDPTGHFLYGYNTSGTQQSYINISALDFNFSAYTTTSGTVRPVFRVRKTDGAQNTIAIDFDEISSQSVCDLVSDEGSPEGVISAPPGSAYFNQLGGVGTSLYLKESGTGNTGWFPLLTLADPLVIPNDVEIQGNLSVAQVQAGEILEPDQTHQLRAHHEIGGSSDGTQWTQFSGALPDVRIFGELVVYKGRLMYLAGGDGAVAIQNTTFVSDDGKNWTSYFGNYTKSGVSDHAACVYKGQIFVAGGISAAPLAFSTDVQVSTDGVSWTKVGDIPNERRDGELVVFKGAMYFIGGANSGGTEQDTVWRSTDGITWVQVGTLSDGITHVSATVHYSLDGNKEQIFVTGQDSANNQEYFKSDDGISWSSFTAPSGTATNGRIISYDGKLWYIGGDDPDNTRSPKVYVSTDDGATWTEVGTDILPTGVRYHEVDIFEGTLVVVGGLESGAGIESDDVQVMVPKVSMGLISGGGLTGSDDGGILGVDTADDFDGTIARYLFQANQDDLWIGPDTDPDSLVYQGADGQWRMTSGLLNLGVDGVQNGFLFIEGDAVFVGGGLRLYHAQDSDSNNLYWDLSVGGESIFLTDSSFNRVIFEHEQTADLLGLGGTQGGGPYMIDIQDTTSVAINPAGTTELTVNASGLALKTGGAVNEIETTITDDDTHIPTSGAVVDAQQAVTRVLTYTLPLTGVTDGAFPWVGTNELISAGETGDFITDTAISNQHVYILVNSITTGGDIVITGTSISESTGLPVTSDTETITVDTSTAQYYQSTKKWWEITNVDITTGTIVGINYDIGRIGYVDLGNTDFKIIGYRLDALSAGADSDLRFIMEHVQDTGSKKMDIHTLEDIGVDADDAGNQIIDHLRTGPDDRSYNGTVANIWPDNTMFNIKMTDFDTYFTADENEIPASSGDTGFLLRIEGEPTVISSVDHVTVHIYYQLI